MNDGPIIPDSDALMRDDRDALRSRIGHMELEREALQKELELVKAELGMAETGRDEKVKELVAKRRRRATLLTAAGINVVIVGAVIGFVVYKTFDEETFHGEVVEATDTSPAAAGERCTFQIEPSYSPFTAYLLVDCNGQRIYGWDSFGYIDCEIEGGRAVTCSDGGTINDGGDPTLHLDRRAGRAVLTDGDRWSFTVALDQ